jgi:hypothetical protein
MRRMGDLGSGVLFRLAVGSVGSVTPGLARSARSTWWINKKRCGARYGIARGDATIVEFIRIENDQMVCPGQTVHPAPVPQSIFGGSNFPCALEAAHDHHLLPAGGYFPCRDETGERAHGMARPLRTVPNANLAAPVFQRWSYKAGEPVFLVRVCRSSCVEIIRVLVERYHGIMSAGASAAWWRYRQRGILG